MNKKIVALAVAAAFAIPAAASAQTTLFGQFKYEVGAVENLDGDRGAVHSSIGTRLGIRGAEDLGGGLQGIYRFQSGFAQVNEGFGNRDVPADEIAEGLDVTVGQSFNLDEEAWVGLQGGFGRVLLGRSDTAFKQASIPFRAFTDTLADLSTRPASFGRAEGVHYVTPSFGGFTVAATVEPNGAEFDSYWSLAGIYRQGPLFVSAAVEGAPDTSDVYPNEGLNTTLYQGGGKAVVADGTNWQVGASYTWNDLTFGVLYQDIDDVAEWITIPVSYAVTPNITLRAAAQYRDPEADGADDGTNFGLGAQYNFSSRTELFANVWADDFTANETPAEGGPVTPGALGGAADKTHFGVGLRHSF